MSTLAPEVIDELEELTSAAETAVDIARLTRSELRNARLAMEDAQRRVEDLAAELDAALTDARNALAALDVAAAAAGVVRATDGTWVVC